MSSYSKSTPLQAFADAMELIPYTLAENAGLSPITTVTELRNQHANGYKNYGVNVRKVCLMRMFLRGFKDCEQVGGI